MKKLFSSIVILVLCCITTISFAQNDTLKCKPKRGLQHLNIEIPKFDQHKWKKDLEQMTLLINGLEKDGLIDSKKPYKLGIKAGELYIDDKKQPAEVSAKFRKHFTSNNYTILND